jgi:hypothetical protein
MEELLLGSPDEESSAELLLSAREDEELSAIEELEFCSAELLLNAMLELLGSLDEELSAELLLNSLDEDSSIELLLSAGEDDELSAMEELDISSAELLLCTPLELLSAEDDEIAVSKLEEELSAFESTSS